MPSKPRPAATCELRPYPAGDGGQLEIAGDGPRASAEGFFSQWVGSVYRVDACGNIVITDQAPQVAGVAPSDPDVWATVQPTASHWEWQILLHGSASVSPDGTPLYYIPPNQYTVTLEADAATDCTPSGTTTYDHVIDYADSRPQIQLVWDAARGPEPQDLTASPGAALRDPATGELATWRLRPGESGYWHTGQSWQDVPVRLYVAERRVYWNDDGTVAEDLRPVPDVELCIGALHQSYDPASDDYPGDITVTCDDTHTGEVTITASTEPDTALEPGVAFDGEVGPVVGLKQAPEEGGEYVLVAEPMDPEFSRGSAWKVVGQSAGTAKRFDVLGGKILDENWAPIIDHLTVQEPVPIHLLVTGVSDAEEVTLSIEQFGQVIQSYVVPLQSVGASTKTADLLLLPPTVEDPGGFPGYVRIDVPSWWFSLNVNVIAQQTSSSAIRTKVGTSVTLARSDGVGNLTVQFVELDPALQESNSENFRVYLRHILDCSPDCAPGTPQEVMANVSPAQTEWGKYSVRMLLQPEPSALERQNLVVTLWAEDPPDSSPALPMGEPGDNLRAFGQGGLSPFWEPPEGWSEAYNCPGPCVQGNLESTWDLQADWVVLSGFLPPVFSGDNYRFGVRLSSRSSPPWVRNSIETQSGVLTTWKAKWLVVCQMLKRGFLIESSVPKGTSTVEVKVPPFYPFLIKNGAGSADKLRVAGVASELGCSGEPQGLSVVCTGTRPMVRIFDERNGYRSSIDDAFIGSIELRWGPDEKYNVATINLKSSPSPSNAEPYLVEQEDGYTVSGGLSPYPVEHWALIDVLDSVAESYRDAYIELQFLNRLPTERILLPHFHANHLQSSPHVSEFPAWTLRSYGYNQVYVHTGIDPDNWVDIDPLVIVRDVTDEGDALGLSWGGSIYSYVDRGLEGYPDAHIQKWVIAHEIDHHIAITTLDDQSVFHCNRSLDGRVDVTGASELACVGAEGLHRHTLDTLERPYLGVGCLIEGFEEHGFQLSGRKNDEF